MKNKEPNYERYLEKLEGLSQVDWVKNYLDLKEKPNFWTIIEYGQEAKPGQKSSHEIRYSKMLRWMFDANENHSLGNVFAYKLLNRIFPEANYQLDVNENIHITAISESLADMDIFYSDMDQKVVLAIELKQFTKEHASTDFKSQLDKYEDAVNHYVANKGEEIQPYYIFLTPLKDAPSNPNWQAVGYQEIIEIIEEINEEYLTPSKGEYKADIEKIVGDFKDDFQRSLDITGKDKSYILKHFTKEDIHFTLTLEKEILGELTGNHIEPLRELAKDRALDLEDLVFIVKDSAVLQDHTPNDGVKLLIRKIYQYFAEDPVVDLSLDRKYAPAERFAKIKPALIEKYQLKVTEIEITSDKGQGIHLLTPDRSHSIYFSGDSKGFFPNASVQLLGYMARDVNSKKPIYQNATKLPSCLFQADYEMLERDKIYLKKSKDEFETKSFEELIENYLLKAVKELEESINE